MEFHSVVCLATSRDHAEDIVQDLRMSEFSDDGISVLLADNGSNQGHAGERVGNSPKGAEWSRRLPPRWFPEMGRLALPEVGPFLATGPVLDALRLETYYDGIVGCLTAMGIDHPQARRVASRLDEGNILIAVHSDDYDAAAYAEKILKAGLAEDICVSMEHSAAYV